jgi:Uma2 family endonuclease
MDLEVLPPTPLRMTEEEFEAWCDEDVKAEFVDGEVIIMSPVLAVHDSLFHFLSKLLGLYVEIRSLGEIRGPEFQIRLRVGLRRVPDLLFIATEHTDRVLRSRVEGAPDASFEIVSEESFARDWKDKVRDYEAAGIREYWIIDLDQQIVRLNRLNMDGKYEPVDEVDGRLVSEVIDGFWLRPAWLWQRPLPKVMDCLRDLGALAA